MGLSGGQKFCLWTIAIGALAILTGSVAPFWLTTHTATASTSYGLWYICNSTVDVDNDCAVYHEWKSLPWTHFSAWFYVVHGGAGLSSLTSLLVVVLSFKKLCTESDSAKVVGVWALLTGLLGLLAAVVFYLESSSSLDLSSVQDESRGWAFTTSGTASGGVTFFSIILLVLPSPRHNAVQPLRR